MARKALPLDTESFLKLLDEQHPARFPDPTWAERKIWMEAGKRDLVETYVHLFNKQSNYDV